MNIKLSEGGYKHVKYPANAAKARFTQLKANDKFINQGMIPVANDTYTTLSEMMLTGKIGFNRGINRLFKSLKLN